MDEPWLSDPQANQTDAPWSADAPASGAAPDGSGFTDEQKQQILAYLPKAKDAADLERYSLEISGGKSKIGNAEDVIAKRDQGHQQFGWTPPTIDKSMGDQINVTPWEKVQATGKAFTEHVANALAMDYGPEVGGLIDTILHPGTDLHTNVAHEHAILSGDSEGHGVASALGEIGGIAATLPVSGIGSAGRLGYAVEHGSTVGNLVRGSVEGAIYGSGAAGPGNRAEGAAEGAILAPVIGAAIRAPLAAYDATKTVLQGSPSLARKIVSKAIKADENTPASVASEMSAAQANDVPYMIADSGENARGLLAAAGRASGPTRTITRDALENRQAGLAERVTNAIERDLGPVSNPHEIADNLMTKARDEAGPIYDSFYSQPPVSSPVIDSMLQRPSMQKALKNAYRIAQEEGADPVAAGLNMGKDGEVSVGAEPIKIYRGENSGNRGGNYYSVDPEFATQFTQRGLREEVKAAHIDPADIYEANPLPLATKEDQFDAAMAAAKAAGKKAFRVDEGAGEPNSVYVFDKSALNRGGGSGGGSGGGGKGFTPQTLDYIKRGMDDVVESYRDPTSGKLVLDTEGQAVNNTLRSYMKVVDGLYPDYAKARAAYAGPVSGINAMNAGRKALNMTADDLEARMRDMTPFEKQMFALGARRAMAELISSKGDSANIINAITGTGKKRAMLARLFGDRPSFNRFVQTLGQEKEGFRTYARGMTGSPTALNLEDDAALKFAATAADMAANGGIPIATAVREAVKFGIGKIGDKTKQQVAALLSETDPARFKELAAELRREATRRAVLKRKVNITTSNIGKAAVAVGGQQSQ